MLNMLLERVRVLPHEFSWLRQSHLSTAFLLLVAVVALSLRIDDPIFVSESLWAESGWIYINQAHDLGMRSLWEPHVGYLWLYARIVALLAKPLPLVAAPYLFFLSWLVAFALIPGILGSRAKLAGLNEFLICFLVCAIVLQPNHGVIFFTLSNVQTVLGLALAFHICIPREKPESVPTTLFLILASLTGPFSTFLTLILPVQWWLLRDFSLRKSTYIIVPLCGLVQSFFIFDSDRAAQTAVDLSATAWSHAISALIFFGGSNKLSNMAALAFWAVTCVFFVRWPIQTKESTNQILRLSPFFSVITSLLLLLLGALASGEGLDRLSPLDMNSRFFFIPYSLIFFTALVCTQRHRAVQTLVVSLISIICAAGFLTVDRPDRASSTGLLLHQNLQWVAFTKFREIRTDVAIPLNPPWPLYPPLFKIDFANRGTMRDTAPPPSQPIVLTSQKIESSQRVIDVKKFAGDSETEPNQSIYFDISKYCVTSRYLAIEVAIWRSKMGHARLYWGVPGGFSSTQSLERFYPGGSTVMQFAFRRDVSEYLIRLDPTEGVASSELVRRLSRSAMPGTIAAKPTEAGGEMALKEARLYCLE